jgi:alpha-tubulin suppressor-like RCC1 family protein
VLGAPAFVAAAALGVLACSSDGTGPSEPDRVAAAQPAAAVAGSALSFRQLSSSGFQTCGVTNDSRAYCWGAPLLGDGSSDQHLGPVAVSGSLEVQQLSSDGSHTCAVTADHSAYCWGTNEVGQLGDGSSSSRQTPVRVGGGLQFFQVEAGGSHTCGVSYPDRRAYCWGSNNQGQLGDGSTTTRLTPVRVLDGRQYRHLSSGAFHTCGLTTAGEAYCWGWNGYGQLGVGTSVSRRVRPALVAGGHLFRQLEVGSEHSCGVTTGYRAFCWGFGGRGQLGDGKTIQRFTPRAVAGGLRFGRVSPGGGFTCGETTENQAYCWGSNEYGQLGDGTTTRRVTPVAVAGGLSFSQVSAGGWHACGRTPAGVGYCWGWNEFGQLGSGGSGHGDSAVPVAVAPPN